MEGGPGGSGAATDDDGLYTKGFEELVALAKSNGLNLSSTQERLIEQLEKRTAKYGNLRVEVERIGAKEIDGLSEGQQRQVERNTGRLKELMEQIESLKEQISETIREQLGAGRAVEEARGRKRGRGGSEGEEGLDDGDDDFFDRTDRGRRKGGRGGGGGGGGRRRGGGRVGGEPSE